MKGKVVITLLLIGALAVGFSLGQQVQANPFAPGSQEDPLVARSYLDEQLQLYVSELEQEVVSLREQAAQMQVIVNQLAEQLID